MTDPSPGDVVFTAFFVQLVIYVQRSSRAFRVWLSPADPNNFDRVKATLSWSSLSASDRIVRVQRFTREW